MDIRRKTTFLSRSTDGRQSQTYSSFFQSAQKKYFNIDPESGMHLVGPMFELTACVEFKGDEDDFEAAYPDSSVTFGPTICSFGLKYNDHNYAMPSGLTPPSMAPHLMDSRHIRKKQNAEAIGSRLARTVESQDSVSTASAQNEAKSSQDGKVSKSSESNSKARHADERSQFAGLWGSSRFSDSCDRHFRDPSLSPRFGKGSSTFEHIEMRYEPDLKVIEVPEELAVSPSQLSDLEGDHDEPLITGKLNYLHNTGSVATIVDGTQINGSIYPRLRCVCARPLLREQLILCPYCNYFQHVACMESHYCVSFPNLTDGYVCPRCGGDESFPNKPQQPSTTFEHAGQPTSTSSILAAELLADQHPANPKGEAGAQYVDAVADKAKRLGLIPVKPAQVGMRQSLSSYYSSLLGRTTERHSPKEQDNKPVLASIDWDRLNELSRCARRPPGDTNINLRVPSPPRASKRKQDLSTKSYKEVEVNPGDSTPEKRIFPSESFQSLTPEVSSASSTPLGGTPSSTPIKFRSTETPTGMRILTPVSDRSGSSGLESPYFRGDKRRHKIGRALFSDNYSPDKRGFSARSHPLRAAWTKDYQEADSNAFSKALLDHIEQHLSSNVEHNYRIPPTWLTRSSLCRVVLFDHDDKGLEASARLSPNEAVIEVRGKFLLLEEYEHYIDPTTEYNRYVMFYRGFSDRALVVDCSQYGNNARFIRRSCVPNCRLDHCIVQDKLQLVIRTLNEIMPGTELTLPFDLDYRTCRYPLDCACARSRCPVLKWRRKLVRNKVVPNLDYGKYIESQLRALSKPLTQESPNSKLSLYDPISLTGSPLLRPRPVTHLSSPNFVASINQTPTKPAVDQASSNALDKSLTADSDSDSTVTNLVTQRGCDVAGSSDKAQSNSPSASDNQPDKLTFQPIITTRRQAAAAMRSTALP